MTTSDFIETLRADIRKGLREEILAELKPEIERRLFANIFDFNEAMRYLKVSKATLRRMTRDREIPYFKQREKLYFRQIDLDQQIAKSIVRKEAHTG